MGHQEFLSGLNGIQSKHHGCVATIGSFDGVHRGHKAILKQVIQKARELSLPSLVIVFEPQPHEYFAKNTPPARLMRLREKVDALFREGVDRVLCLKFDRHLRSLTAEAYIEDVLVQSLGIKHLVVGDDFRFGCDRSGDFQMLSEAGKQYGFTVCDTVTQLEAGERISSTRIRALLQEGDLEAAKALLGHDYEMAGRVIYGRQLGRQLGYPTLNIGLGRYRSAVEGVFAVRVLSDFTTEPWSGVANVGTRPTVSGGAKPLLEVHLLDATVNLYGHFVTVVFEKKIRGEKRFADLDALKQQIHQDSLAAREYFGLMTQA